MDAAAVNVCEQELYLSAIDDVPIAIWPGTLVIADQSHQPDRLRDNLAAEELVPLIPQ